MDRYAAWTTYVRTVHSYDTGGSIREACGRMVTAKADEANTAAILSTRSASVTTWLCLRHLRHRCIVDDVGRQLNGVDLRPSGHHRHYDNQRRSDMLLIVQQATGAKLRSRCHVYRKAAIRRKTAS